MKEERAAKWLVGDNHVIECDRGHPAKVRQVPETHCFELGVEIRVADSLVFENYCARGTQKFWPEKTIHLDQKSERQSRRSSGEFFTVAQPLDGF